MKKTLGVTLFLGLSLLAVSCGGSSSDSESSSSSQYGPSEGLIDSDLNIENDLSYQAAYPLNPTGEDKILVVPVHIKGEQEFTSAMFSNVERGFFDESLSSGEDNYFSVSEYYHDSSYGKLHLSGEVTDLVEIDYTLDEITANSYYMPTLAANAYYSVASAETLKKYDSDSDGFVDAVCFIYSSPMDVNKNLWAWCYNFSAKANVDKPNFRRHMWCSAEAFSNSLYAVDAHTAIHETGHLLGLRDYYPSDNNYIALGGHSMMDYNISDHDPYTKMMLGWAQPTYYDLSGVSSVEVTLNAFQHDGSFILLKNNWNHTVMDEYLLLEYYTPEYLNAPDSKKQYTERPLGFTKAGLKIYHADSRMAELSLSADGSSFSFIDYVTDSSASLEDGHYYMIGANNNESSSYTDASRKGRYKQIAIVENKKINTLQSGASSDDDSLFYVGDKFDSSDSAYLLGGNYNDKSSVNVAVEVISSDSAKMTLRLSNLGA